MRPIQKQEKNKNRAAMYNSLAISEHLEKFNSYWGRFLSYLPFLAGGIICLIITILLANFVSRIIVKYALKRSRDELIANFVGKVLWSVVFILGTVLALGIL